MKETYRNMVSEIDTYRTRFEILYQYYMKKFFGHKLSANRIIENVKSTIGFNDTVYVVNNRNYLYQTGYLGYIMDEPEEVDELGITFFGIKFFDEATDGNICFEETSEKRCHLSRVKKMFKERDTMVNEH